MLAVDESRLSSQPMSDPAAASARIAKRIFCQMQASRPPETIRWTGKSQGGYALTIGGGPERIVQASGKAGWEVRMQGGPIAERDLLFRPVTAENWKDLEELFGGHGAYAGCWCMWWRIRRSEFDRRTGEEKRQALKGIVDSGTVPGILAYLAGRPVGWCAIAPREQFPVLDRSPVLKRVDEQAVWSIVCFFIARPFRGRGLNRLLIEGAVDYARKHGARIIEAYPVDTDFSRNTSTEAFTGFARTFFSLGFTEVIRRSGRRPLLRLRCGP